MNALRLALALALHILVFPGASTLLAQRPVQPGVLHIPNTWEFPMHMQLHLFGAPQGNGIVVDRPTTFNGTRECVFKHGMSPSEAYVAEIQYTFTCESFMTELARMRRNSLISCFISDLLPNNSMAKDLKDALDGIHAINSAPQLNELIDYLDKIVASRTLSPCEEKCIRSGIQIASDLAQCASVRGNISIMKKMYELLFNKWSHANRVSDFIFQNKEPQWQFEAGSNWSFAFTERGAPDRNYQTDFSNGRIPLFAKVAFISKSKPRAMNSYTLSVLRGPIQSYAATSDSLSGLRTGYSIDQLQAGVEHTTFSLQKRKIRFVASFEFGVSFNLAQDNVINSERKITYSSDVRPHSWNLFFRPSFGVGHRGIFLKWVGALHALPSEFDNNDVLDMEDLFTSGFSLSFPLANRAKYYYR